MPEVPSDAQRGRLHRAISDTSRTVTERDSSPSRTHSSSPYSRTSSSEASRARRTARQRHRSRSASFSRSSRSRSRTERSRSRSHSTQRQRDRSPSWSPSESFTRSRTPSRSHSRSASEHTHTHSNPSSDSESERSHEGRRSEKQQNRATPEVIAQSDRGRLPFKAHPSVLADAAALGLPPLPAVISAHRANSPHARAAALRESQAASPTQRENGTTTTPVAAGTQQTIASPLLLNGHARPPRLSGDQAAGAPTTPSLSQNGHMKGNVMPPPQRQPSSQALTSVEAREAPPGSPQFERQASKSVLYRQPSISQLAASRAPSVRDILSGSGSSAGSSPTGSIRRSPSASTPSALLSGLASLPSTRLAPAAALLNEVDIVHSQGESSQYSSSEYSDAATPDGTHGRSQGRAIAEALKLQASQSSLAASGDAGREQEDREEEEDEEEDEDEAEELTATEEDSDISNKFQQVVLQSPSRLDRPYWSRSLAVAHKLSEEHLKL